MQGASGLGEVSERWVYFEISTGHVLHPNLPSTRGDRGIGSRVRRNNGDKVRYLKVSGGAGSVNVMP